MADVPGKFFKATKVRTGVSPSSPGVIEGETLPPVNPPGGSLNSVGLSMPSAFNVANSPLTSNGTLAVTGAGTVGQYIRGDGSLADFPQASGGGSSVSYYLNGSVDQGTIGGVAYRELSKVPILGAGTDFTINADGYIASFITDAGDPNLLEIPGGNWNFETYFSASSGGGSPTFYVELYKVSGTTATLIASSSSVPELIAFGTNLTPYFSTLAVPTTTLALTDRLAIRYYVTHSGRTITMHTENNHLCQIITTFTTGLTALNGLTAQVQNFAVGTSGTDFNIASATATHTFNLPTASATNRGALSSADWSLFTQAYNDKINSASVTGTTTKTLTLVQQDGGEIQASWSDLNTDAVTSVFGRTGAVVAVSGDYNTSQVTESGNLYFTQARVSANTDVAANTAARHAAVTLGTANGLGLTGQQLSLGLASAGVTGALSGTDWSTFNSKQQALNGTGFVKISGTTISYDNSTYLTTAVAASTYLPLAGGTMTGNINWGQTDRGLTWAFNTDAAYIKFFNTGDGDTDSRLEFGTQDNNNEYFRWGHVPSGGSFYESMRLVPNGNGSAQLIVTGSIIKSGGTSSQFLKADGSVDSNTYITGNQTISLSGDATGSGATAITVVLANSGVTAGTYNNVATQVRPFTVDAKGRVTSIGTAVTITPAFSDVTGKPTTLAGYGITDAYTQTQVNTLLAGYLPLSGGTMTGQIVLTTGTSGGVRFPNDPFGGSGDTAGMRLISRGGEAMSLEIYTTNDADDWVNLVVPSNDSAKINGNTIWNAGNITPVPTSRTITINGTTQDLSDNRTFNVGTVTSVTASSPLFSSGGTTPNITIQQASGSQNGFLSSTDWNTFNNKQNALTNPVTGTGTTNYLPKFTGTSTIGNSNLINDASGNLGLGVTPSAWDFPAVIQLNTSGAFLFGGGNTILGFNAFFQGGWKYVSNNFANYYEQNAGQHRWFNAPSGTAGNAISFTQAMTLFSTGNLLVGSPSPISDNGARLQVSGTATFSGAYGTSSGVYLSGTTYGVYGANRGASSASAGMNYFSVGSQRWFTGIYENSDNFGFYSVATNGFPLILNYSTGAATFSSSVTAASFSVGNGTLSNSGFWGTLITAGTGSFANFALIDSATNGIMYNPTGTLNMSFVGSVGIGTAVSNNTLNIYNDNNAGISLQSSFTGTTANDGFYIGQLFQSNNFLFRQRENAAIIFETNNGSNEAMRIFAGGNTHIGPTPISDNGARLQVSGTGTFAGVGFGSNGIQTSGANGGNGIYSVAGGSAGSGVYGFTNDLSSFAGTFQHTGAGAGIALRVIGWSTFSQAATFSSSVTATGGLISNGGSIGYGGGELGFNVTTSGATSGIYTTATGSPILYFDHRATGNTGFWVWRSGTGGATTALTLSNVGAATFSSSGLFNGNLQTNGVLTIGNQSVAGNYALQITPSTTNRVSMQAILAGVGISDIVMQPSGGNVGIGTPGPSQLLHLYTNLATSSGVGTAMQITSDGAGGDNAWIGVNKGSGNGLEFSVENRDIIFNTGATTPFGGTERMRIDSNGTMILGGTSTTGTAGTGSGRGNLILAGSTSNKLTFNNNSTTVNGYVYSDGSELQISSGAGYMNFYSGNTERMRIFSGGNVRIGSSSFGDNGNLLRVGGTGWFDGNILMDSAANRFVGFGTGSENPYLMFSSNGSIILNVETNDTYNFFRGGSSMVSFTGSGIETIIGGLRTAAPTGTSNDFWRLGRALLATSSTPEDRWIRVQISNRIYDILAIDRGLA